MAPETPYRLTLAAVFLATLTTAGYYRLQAAKSDEKLSRRDEGLLLFLAIRLAGLALFGGALAYLLHPPWMQWASLPLPAGVRWTGAVLGVLASWLLWATLKTLGSNLTDTVAIRARHTLVIGGPYRWVRHPYYDALLLLVLASSLVAANWFLLASGLTVFVLLAIRTPIEERKLVERFGDEYRAYRERTGRFLPRG